MNASPDGGLAPAADGTVLDFFFNRPPTTEPATYRRPGRKTDRRNPRAASVLTEPIVTGTFRKNRRGETIQVTLRCFEGRDLVDVRQFFPDANGRMQASKKGVAMSVLRLPELVDVLSK